MAQPFIKQRNDVDDLELENNQLKETIVELRAQLDATNRHHRIAVDQLERDHQLELEELQETIRKLRVVGESGDHG